MDGRARATASIRTSSLSMPAGGEEVQVKRIGTGAGSHRMRRRRQARNVSRACTPRRQRTNGHTVSVVHGRARLTRCCIGPRMERIIFLVAWLCLSPIGIPHALVRRVNGHARCECRSSMGLCSNAVCLLYKGLRLRACKTAVERSTLRLLPFALTRDWYIAQSGRPSKWLDWTCISPASIGACSRPE